MFKATLSVVALSLSDASFAGARVSDQEVKHLAYLALEPSEQRLPGLSFELDNGTRAQRRIARYIYVTVFWASPPTHSVVVENLAVDSKTADVWSATTSCKEYHNAAMHRLQARIRHEIGLSGRAYKRLKSVGPLC